MHGMRCMQTGCWAALTLELFPEEAKKSCGVADRGLDMFIRGDLCPEEVIYIMYNYVTVWRKCAEVPRKLFGARGQLLAGTDWGEQGEVSCALERVTPGHDRSLARGGMW